MKTIWTNKWPVSAGRYWFYGVRFQGQDKKDLFIVKVMICSDGSPVYVCEGNFLYRSEGAEGMFASLPEPDLP